MLCIRYKRTIRNLALLVFCTIALAYCITSRAQSRGIYSDSILYLKKQGLQLGDNERLAILNNSHIATIYNQWAKKESNKGYYQFATDIYAEALKINPLNNNSRFLLEINLCELYLRRGMYSSAKEILDTLSPTIQQRFVYFSNLSSYYLYINELDSAKRTLNYLERIASTKEEKSNVASNLAYLYLQQKDYLSSYTILSKELQNITDNKRKYILLSHKAIVEANLGLLSKAIIDIDSCLKWQKTNLGISHQDYIISLRKQAEILQICGKIKDAASAFRQYVEYEKESAAKTFQSFTEQQRLDYWKNKKSLLSEPFSLECDNLSYIEFLYNLALFRRQVALLGRNDSLNIVQKLSISKDNVSKNLGKNDIAIEFVKYEKENKNRYAALLLSGSDKKNVRFVPLWLEDSIGGNRLDSALCSKVRADKDKVYQNEALSAFVWDKLLPFIPEGSTVYFAPDGILHLLAIEYLPSVNNGKYELHRLTTTGLLAEKKKKAKKTNTKALVVGGMDYDFIAPKDDSGSVTVNQDAFRYLLQNKKLMYFTYLPGSRVETDSIINFLSGIDRYEDIDESSLKNKMGNYGKVHLATHGYSWHVDIPSVPYAFRDSITEDKSLLASGIALSGANELYRFPLRDDGLLSARELCEMNLTGIDLVVASSCQSAQGRVSDEGPTGLVRGLKKAGVRTIIASLWPVSDKATMLLMQFFYDEWREGKGKDGRGCSKTHALHLAQERLKEIEGNPVKIRTYNSTRKTGDYKTVTTKFDSPYYWAPFIIIDDI